MSDKASIFSGNVAWVAGVVVAMGVSVFALVSTGVLDGGDQPVVEDTTTKTAAPVVNTETNPSDLAGEPEQNPTSDASAKAEVTDQPAETAAVSQEKTPAKDSASTEAAAAPETLDEQAAPIIAPSFDIVRVDAEGNTVVAGAAAPGAMLGILLDGTEVALAPVDTSGKFAAILAIEPSNAARVLSLVERRDEGDVLSDATVIVAPVVAVAKTMVVPEVAAQTEKSTAPEPTPTQNVVAETESVVEATQAEVASKDTSTQTEADVAEIQVSNAVKDIEVAVKSTPDEADQSTKDAETEVVIPATEPKAPAVIVSDSEGVRVVQPAAPTDATPEVLAAVSIDSISYTDSGAVMVSGRGNPNAFVRLYLDNALAATTQIDDAGLWATQLGDVAGGLYELRADEVDEAAKVLSRVVTPFKRETPETVAQARAQAEAVAAAENTSPSADDTATESVKADQQPVANAEAPTEAPQSTAEAAPATTTTPDQSVSQEDSDAAEQAKSSSEGQEAASAPAEQPEVMADVSDTAVDIQTTPGPIQTPEAAQEAAQAPETEPANADTNTVAEPTTAVQTQPETAQPPVRIVTVQPGATLWAIARDRYGEGQLYLQVFEANKDKIRDPNLIYPGQVFTVPEE